MKPIAAVQLVCALHHAQGGQVLHADRTTGTHYMPEDVPMGAEIGPDPSSAWGVLIAAFLDHSRAGIPLVFGIAGGGTLLRTRNTKVHAYPVRFPQPCGDCDGDQAARALFHLLQVAYGIRPRVDAAQPVLDEATRTARTWGLIKGHEITGAGRVWLLAEARFQGIELEPAASPPPDSHRTDGDPGLHAIQQATQLIYQHQQRLVLNSEEMTTLRVAMTRLYEAQRTGDLSDPETRSAVRSLLHLAKPVLLTTGGVQLIGDLQKIGG